MENYERIYVVSELRRYDDFNFDGETCEVAYRSLDEAKRKYEELKESALKLWGDCQGMMHEEDFEGEYIQIYQQFETPTPPLYAFKKTFCVIKIDHLDLKLIDNE